MVFTCRPKTRFPRPDLALFAGLLLVVLGCSDSEFGGGAGGIGSSGDTKAESKDDQGSDGSDGDHETAYDVNGSADLEEREENASHPDAEFDEKGCVFPQNIDSANDEDASFDLGWGSTGKDPSATEIELDNLNVKDCDWYEGHKASSAKPLMLVYNNSQGQSYATPFNGGLSLFTSLSLVFGKGSRGTSEDSVCQRAATTMSNEIKSNGHPGVIQCSLVP